MADNRKISIICEQKVVRKGNLFVVKGIIMKYDKKAAIDNIVNAAINYKEYLQDKIFLIIYQENLITKTAQVEFRDNKEDIRKLSQPTNKVLAIFVKNYNQTYYTKCTYLSKGQEIDKLPISKEIKALIQIKNDGTDDCE